MKFYIVVIISGFLCTSVQLSPAQSSYSTSTKVSDANIVNQTKRDLSLSYAATDIDSKEGTRIKTITVIKNVGNKNKQQPLEINPELHKNEEWGSAFRNNFDLYGKIPEVPDIDDLFDFVNKKPEEKDKNEGGTEAPVMKEIEKPVREESAEMKESPQADDEDPIEKIKGDAELIPSSSNKKHSTAMSRSQSLSVGKYRVQEPMIDANFSTPQHSVQQQFDKYIAEIPNTSLGYDYPKPCVKSPPASIPVTESSGRTYDIPVNNNNDGKRYIAPAISKRTQVQPQGNQQQAAANSNSGNPVTFPVNSLLPPQPSQGGYNSVNTTPQQRQQVDGLSTTQRNYLAPSLRNGLSTSLPPPSVTVYIPGPTNFRTNTYGFRGIRPNVLRSRGLKY